MLGDDFCIAEYEELDVPKWDLPEISNRVSLAIGVLAVGSNDVVRVCPPGYADSKALIWADIVPSTA